MCGIAGFLNLNKQPASQVVLKRMTDSIAHRGPDAEGQYVDGPAAIGHRRLAIIDLSPAAAQPMIDPQSRYVISYNGEIYNFKTLRTELVALGHEFHSQSDTEVALHAYMEWGSACVSRFNGIFAFVIWDREEKKLFIARDRYGVKPLYYCLRNEIFAFASENKAFDFVPGMKREIDPRGLLEYMTFQNFFGRQTLFKDVEIFPAGHVGEIDFERRQLKLNQYWDFDFNRSTGKKISQNEYIEELDRLIRQAVNRQLVSDVEIGAFLSGGMDSGSITALAAMQLPYMKTFTVGFDLSSASGLELSYDERAKAEHMSYLFKTEHYEMVLKSGDMERCMKSLVHHLEEPRVGQSYPNFYASKLASKFTKVCLSGCGGDEIFGGYPWRYYRSVGHKDFETYIDEYYLYWHRLIPNKSIQKLFSPIWNQVSGVWTRDIFSEVYKGHRLELETSEDYINHSMYFEAKTFLHGLLVVEDKLSMAHSLEVRVPFLDNDLVDFAQNIPVQMKLANLNQVARINENEPGKKGDKYFSRTSDGKIILREVMSRYVPQTVTEREKQGFSAPDASWFKGDSIEFVKNKLLNPRANIYSYLAEKPVHELLHEHLSGQVNRRLFVWSLLNLEYLLEEL